MRRDLNSGYLFLTLVACFVFGRSAPLWAQGMQWSADCSTVDTRVQREVGSQELLVIREIPSHKRNVRIDLASDVNVDIQLIDVRTGTEIIAWPWGVISGPQAAEAYYEGVHYQYSGYDGDGVNPGNEYITVGGLTNRPLELRIYGYVGGTATVSYAWEAESTCNERGQGMASVRVEAGETAHLGEIPAGKTNIILQLQSGFGADLDIQILDGPTKIIAWDVRGDHGLLHGAGYQILRYRGLTIAYSGYDGRGGHPGFEDVVIAGRLPSALTVQVYGYQAGAPRLHYLWGMGAGVECDSLTSFSCPEAMTCKALVADGNIDRGACHTEQWCHPDTAERDCAGVASLRSERGSPGGFWGCQDFMCQWTRDVSLGDLWALAPQLQGERIRVTGKVESIAPDCPRARCPDGGLCCQACGGSPQMVGIDGRRVALDGLLCGGGHGGGGEDCVAEPSLCESVNGSFFTVVGEVRAEDGVPTIAVQERAPADLGCTLHGNTVCPAGTSCYSACAVQPGGCDEDVGVCVEQAPPCKAPSDYERISPRRVVADREAYEGQLVAMTWRTTLQGPACTLRSCSEDEPCCNACAASAVFQVSATEGIYLDGAPFRCGGSNCSWEDQCEAIAGSVVTVWGRLLAKPGGSGSNFKVHGWCDGGHHCDGELPAPAVPCESGYALPQYDDWGCTTGYACACWNSWQCPDTMQCGRDGLCRGS